MVAFRLEPEEAEQEARAERARLAAFNARQVEARRERRLADLEAMVSALMATAREQGDVTRRVRAERDDARDEVRRLTEHAAVLEARIEALHEAIVRIARPPSVSVSPFSGEGTEAGAGLREVKL